MEKKGHQDKLIFYVNGKKIIEENPEPEAVLATYLRQQLKLTGTKISCGVGQCGACTVMISQYDPITKKISHRAVNSCLTPLCSVHGLAVTTVEGIGSTRKSLHPVQERLAKSHGIQCGFCSPGMVMSMYALLRNNPTPTQHDVESALKGNLCRCTGYRPILEGFSTFTQGTECPLGEKCCKNDRPTQKQEEVLLYDAAAFKPYDPSQEVIFPSELQLSNHPKESRVFTNDRDVWHHPASLPKVLELKSKYPSAVLVCGATRVGLDWKVRPSNTKKQYIYISHLPELNKIRESDAGLLVGAAVTITQLENDLKKRLEGIANPGGHLYAAITNILQWFGGHQLKNTASIGGTVMCCGTKSDLLPLLAACSSRVLITGKGGKREETIDMSFFTGPGSNKVKPEEVVTGVMFAHMKKGQFCSSYKQGPRKDLALATLNSGMIVDLDGHTVINASLCFGGLKIPVVSAANATKCLIGSNFNDLPLEKIRSALAKDVEKYMPNNDRLASFKVALAQGFFLKFSLFVKSLLAGQTDDLVDRLPVSRGIQVVEDVVPDQDVSDPIGRPLSHRWALPQAAGEAVYIDDMAPHNDELHMAFVLSSKPHAKILNVDPSAALKLPGVVDYIDHNDVPGSNTRSVSILEDETVFAKDEVLHDGQIIAAIVAETPQQAKAGARAVIVDYQELHYITSIEEAIAIESFYDVPDVEWTSGDPATAFKEADKIIEGEFQTSGQEQFYMETQSVRVLPLKENNEFEVICSQQWLHGLQMAMAKTLGLPLHKIQCKTRRLGGGFGGKETRSLCIALPCAVAAYKLNRPVRCVLDRYEDMRLTGGRHPYLFKYKAGVSKTGHIEALDIEMYNNAGCTIEISGVILEASLFACDNCYDIDNRHMKGVCCKTNRHSNHAMRGAGQPQAVFAAEYVMYDVAKQLEIPLDKIQEQHFFKNGSKTFYNQALENCNIQRCWDEMKFMSGYVQRVEEISKFNRENKWRKRGLALMPIKMCPLFPFTFMNQASAFVVVYTDGSVLVTHGGVEMGQGIHTKMIQVASRALSIPVDKILIQETSTSSIPNASTTGGSSATDLNGMAIIEACEKINENLAPFKQKNPNGKWEDWVIDAYQNRVSLIATGFHKLPGLDFDQKKGGGTKYPYYVFGAGCTEVEVDCLTGDHWVPRVDLVMDVGKSINPAIDIGQVEGAFMQGYGMGALEEIRYDKNGLLETNSPDTYKIPLVTNIPRQFNVAFLKDAPNPKAVYSSKAIGEPPLFLGLSVYFAIKEAVGAFREEAGLPGLVDLGIPSTPEKVMLACAEALKIHTGSG